MKTWWRIVNVSASHFHVSCSNPGATQKTRCRAPLPLSRGRNIDGWALSQLHFGRMIFEPRELMLWGWMIVLPLRECCIKYVWSKLERPEPKFKHGESVNTVVDWLCGTQLSKSTISFFPGCLVEHRCCEIIDFVTSLFLFGLVPRKGS